MIIALYVASVCADIASTIYARRRGAREGNPLLRAAGRFWLPVRIVLGAMVLVVWSALDAPDWVLIVAAGLYVAVAVSNVTVARSV